MSRVYRPISTKISELCRNYPCRDLCSDNFANQIKEILDDYTELDDLAVVLDIFVGYRKIEQICLNLYKQFFSSDLESNIDIQDFYRKYSLRFNNL